MFFFSPPFSAFQAVFPLLRSLVMGTASGKNPQPTTASGKNPQPTTALTAFLTPSL